MTKDGNITCSDIIAIGGVSRKENSALSIHSQFLEFKGEFLLFLLSKGEMSCHDCGLAVYMVVANDKCLILCLNHH